MNKKRLKPVDGRFTKALKRPGPPTPHGGGEHHHLGPILWQSVLETTSLIF